MKEFALFFRMNLSDPSQQPSEEQMIEYMNSWNIWIQSIREKNQLIPGGNHFSKKGTVLLPGKQQKEGPYESDNCSVAGYILIRVNTMEEAINIAKKCPILNGKNTSVEVRETHNSEMNQHS